MKLYSITDILGYKAYAQVFTLCPSPQEANNKTIGVTIEFTVRTTPWLDCCSAIRRSLAVKQVITRCRKSTVPFILVYADEVNFSVQHCIAYTAHHFEWSDWLKSFPDLHWVFRWFYETFVSKLKEKWELLETNQSISFATYLSWIALYKCMASCY